jgi:predicted phage baseplate assembly protein
VSAATHALVPAPAAKDDPLASEANTVHNLQTADGHTTIRLGDVLQNWYDPTAVTIAANVAPATHGQTVREVLGSGDGTQANQRFVLKKPPLTYVSAATPTGGKSTLAVSVGGMQWLQQPSLYGLDARSQSYAVRIGDDAKPTVIFGDGVSGARLPTGIANVTAIYRSGTGLDGNVDAGSLTLLQTRPLGVRGVTNPVAATGGADQELLDNARQNAPLKVLTLDRIVSLQDYEDFARAFGAVGKAQAVALWSGETRIVHITIADAQGHSIASTSTTYTSLLAAIRLYGDPTQQVIVQGYTPRTFSLAATLTLDPRYDPDAVRAQVHGALTSAFSFAERDFGQPVTAAEVVTLIQGVAGVIAVDLTMLQTDAVAATSAAFTRSALAMHGSSSSGTAGGYLVKAMLSSRAATLERSAAWSWMLRNWGVPAILPAQKAHWEANAIQPAELLLLNPRGVTV